MNKSKRAMKFAALALPLLATGCMSLAPSYERPAMPVATSFFESRQGAAVAAADLEWRRFFADARLQRLIEIALQNNRDLRVAILNIEQARAQYQVRRADQLPGVGVLASGSRGPNSKGEISSTYMAGLSVTSYELDFFGRVNELSKAALGEYLATEEARKNVHITLIASVANIYLSLLADDELLALTRQTLKAREESFKLIQLKFEHGVVSELDLRQGESLVETAHVALAQQMRQRAVDQNALVLLVGQGLPADLPASNATLHTMQIGAELSPGLPSDLLTRRPDIRQAEQQLIAANANIGAARAAFFPRISLTGSAGSVSDELSGLFKSGSFAWTVAPQLLLPIFDAGRNRANLDIAKATRDIRVAQYEKAVQLAFREVADALAGQATYGEQLRAQRAQADAEAVRYKLSDLRYNNGASSYLDLLDAQRSLFAAQQAEVQTNLASLQNQVTLYKVLGGGWQEQEARP